MTEMKAENALKEDEKLIKNKQLVYYTVNLNGAGVNHSDTITYQSLDDAVKAYQESDAGGKRIGFSLNGKEVDIAYFGSDGINHMMKQEYIVREFNSATSEEMENILQNVKLLQSVLVLENEESQNNKLETEQKIDSMTPEEKEDLVQAVDFAIDYGQQEHVSEEDMELYEQILEERNQVLEFDGKDNKRILSEREIATLDAPTDRDIAYDKLQDRYNFQSHNNHSPQLGSTEDKLREENLGIMEEIDLEIEIN